MRKLEWKKETAFEGWACSDCGWIFPNPVARADHPTRESIDREAREQFDEHVCKEHPRNTSDGGLHGYL
jgi:hypothetical protein